MNGSLVLNAVGLALTLAISHSMLRHAATLPQTPFEFPRVAYTLVALSIYVLLFLYYSQLLQRFALSRLYPLYTALSVVFVYVAGALVFREPISLRSLVGTCLIIAGVLVVTGESRP